MKKIVLISVCVLVSLAKSKAQNCTECRPPYPPTQANAIVLADLTIDAMNVHCNDGRCKAKITVKNLQDDTSRETQLVITLPIESTFINAAGQEATFRQCGNTVTFCLGEINPGISREVTIETSNISNPNYLNMETFGAFVYGSLPDICPVNNFKSWVNTGIGDNCKKFKHVKVGRE